MPFDLLRLVFDFLTNSDFKQLRVNKEFTRLIYRKKKGITFINREITVDMFRKIVSKNSHV